jgi:hypothetical protein
VTQGFFDLTQVDSSFPAWQLADAEWGARAAQGPGVKGGPEGTRTSYFYNNSFAPFGKTWGAPFAPTELCPVLPPPACDPFLGDCPPPCDPFLEPCPPPEAPPIATVPNVQCMSLPTASLTLATFGYPVGEVKPGNPGPDFVVSDSRPGAGAQLATGNAVDLTLRARSKIPACR